MFKPFKFLYSPNDLTGPTGGTTEPIENKEMSTQDMAEFLKDDGPEEDGPIDLKPKKEIPAKKEDDTKEDKEEDEDEETEDESDDDELEDLLNEDEKPTDEQLELTTPVRRKEILKKYPQLFKDFPYLEKAYYREQQFTELLPTIDDAKEAVEAKSTLERFEKDLMSGSTETILRAVKDQDPESFNRIVDDYMPTLAKVDEKAYLHILGNTTKYTIAAMLQEARTSNNEALKAAAQVLHQFTFGSSTWSDPTKLAKDKPDTVDPKEAQLAEREQKFINSQFQTTRSDLNTRLNNSVKSTIEQNIDPRGSMSDYVKRTAVREAGEALNKLVSQDIRFKAITDKLWEKAIKDNFSRDSTENIRKAFLSKARTLLPSVIKKARIEALRGTGKRVREDDDTNEEPPVRKVKSNKDEPPSNRRGKITKASDIPKGMRTIDFLNSD
jgi:hypothetical protein